jgi:upstream activation factor subunit UAF30
MKGPVGMIRRDMLEAKFGSKSPAFSEPMTPDPALSAVIGSHPLPRSEIIKKLWDYIRAHGLQDKNQQMLINSDETLLPVFDGRSQVTIIELMKLLSSHLQPTAG